MKTVHTASDAYEAEHVAEMLDAEGIGSSVREHVERLPVSLREQGSALFRPPGTLPSLRPPDRLLKTWIVETEPEDAALAKELIEGWGEEPEPDPDLQREQRWDRQMEGY